MFGLAMLTPDEAGVDAVAPPLALPLPVYWVEAIFAMLAIVVATLAAISTPLKTEFNGSGINDDVAMIDCTA